jgi:hypothetical protein
MFRIFDNKNIFKFLILIFSLVICGRAYGNERINYGEIWNSWSQEIRYFYLQGFHDGAIDMTAFINRHYLIPLETDKDKFNETEKAIIYKTAELMEDRWISKAYAGALRTNKPLDQFSLEEIRDVMTYLYSDPMNKFIRIERMIFFARDKLRGEKIEDNLIEWRKLTDKIFNKTNK